MSSTNAVDKWNAFHRKFTGVIVAFSTDLSYTELERYSDKVPETLNSILAPVP